jgi:hypothetical protein
MARALTILGMVVAVLIFCLFAVDLAIRMPFERASGLLDTTLIICSAILGYLSWSAYKEQT